MTGEKVNNKRDLRNVGIFIGAALILFALTAGAIVLTKERDSQVVSSQNGGQVAQESDQGLGKNGSSDELSVTESPESTVVPESSEQSAGGDAGVTSDDSAAISSVPSTGFDVSGLMTGFMVSLTFYFALRIRQHRYLYRQLDKKIN